MSTSRYTRGNQELRMLRACPHSTGIHHRPYGNLGARPRPACPPRSLARARVLSNIRRPHECAIGRVDGLEQAALPDEHALFECRNNRLAWLGIQQDDFLAQVRAAIARHGADRVALLAATSTSSIGATEEAYARLDGGRIAHDLRRPPVHTPHSLGIFLEQALGTRGPCLTTATACSSSAKIFAKAERMIRLGVVDAAVLVGVDSLCGSERRPASPCLNATQGLRRRN